MCGNLFDAGGSGGDLLRLGTSAASLYAAGGQAAGQRAQAAGAEAYGQVQEAMAEVDALHVQDASRAQAERILRAASKQKGQARAATAASGVRLDEFALMPEQQIDELANEDAAMTILSGDRQARSLRFGGRMAKYGGQGEASGYRARASNTMFDGLHDSLRGWKGAQSKPAATEPFYDGTTGDFAFEG